MIMFSKKFKQYFTWLELIPIAAIALCFLQDDEIHHHLVRNAISMFLYSLMYAILYSMMIYLKVNKFISLFIAFLLTLGICYLKWRLKKPEN